MDIRVSHEYFQTMATSRFTAFRYDNMDLKKGFFGDLRYPKMAITYLRAKNYRRC
jgi:hypothetical protein